MRWHRFAGNVVRVGAYDADARRLLLGLGDAERCTIRGYRFEAVPPDVWQRLLRGDEAPGHVFASAIRDRFQFERASASRLGGVLPELYARGFTRAGLSHGDP